MKNSRHISFDPSAHQEKLVFVNNSERIATFKKTTQEHAILRTAKKAYSDLRKNQIRFKETRDDIIKTLIDSKAPNWGNIKVDFSK